MCVRLPRDGCHSGCVRVQLNVWDGVLVGVGDSMGRGGRGGCGKRVAKWGRRLGSAAVVYALRDAGGKAKCGDLWSARW